MAYVQIRIKKDRHQKVKRLAVDREMLISDLMTEIVDFFFERREVALADEDMNSKDTQESKAAAEEGTETPNNLT